MNCFLLANSGDVGLCGAFFNASPLSTPIRVTPVSFAKARHRTSAPGADLYVSPLFRRVRAYAKAQGDT